MKKARKRSDKEVKAMIPVCEPTITGNEEKYVVDCIRTNWISSRGKYIEMFEKAFSRFCKAKHGIACTSGTTALHLAIESLGIGAGDEVIMPSFTMIATANAAIYSGARPVLAESEPETWNIDPKRIEEKITSRTKAIMAVHTYGHPCDMDAITAIAKKHKLAVIEDAAEAHGAEYKGRRVGGIGNVSAFSFYANKIITTGEGGMLVTNDDRLAERGRLLRDHAFTPDRFRHYELGFNYRLTNLQAAVGVAQLEHAEELVEMRRKNAARYTQLLKGVPGIVTPPEAAWARNVYWMYGILVKEKEFGMSKDKMMKELREKGIDTRSFFLPLHRQPLFVENKKNDARFPDTRGSYPVAEMLGGQGLYLPSSSHLEEEEIRKICDTIKDLKRR